MAEDKNEDSKTFEPTEKRLMDARKKGDVPSSRETGNMMVIGSLFGCVAFILPWLVPGMTLSLARLIETSGSLTVGSGQTGIKDLGVILYEFSIAVMIGVAPIFGLMIVGALIGTLIQGSVVVSLERITPKLSKISPLEGFKRLFSASAFVEFGKNLLKVLVAGTLALWITRRSVSDIMAAPGFIPEALPLYIMNAAQALLVAMAIFLVPVALFDIFWKRYDWRKRQMMSFKEVRDEQKESEGAPELRAKRASIRRKLSQQRIAVAVPTANVILTNPTHFAVALKYEMGSDVAPICVAKGADNMARRIREIAFENDIPVIENKPLARLLFDQVEVDGMVPGEHWEIVAKIISFVINTGSQHKLELPEGSKLRDLADEVELN
jgi:flagellar biosynthetic protein FlhB